MSRDPSDDVLESLYKLRIRESAQLISVLELYDMEIHQKMSVPNYQKLKTMEKRSIDQKLRLRNFDAARERLVSIGILPNFNSIFLSGCKARDKCSFPHHEVDEQPNKKPKRAFKTGKKRRQRCCSYCGNCTTIGLRLARLGCTGFSKRKTASGKPNGKSLGIDSIVRCTQSALRQARIRENKGPSIGQIQVEIPHQRSPYAMKFDDPRRNGYSPLPQQKSRRKESLW